MCLTLTRNSNSFQVNCNWIFLLHTVQYASLCNTYVLAVCKYCSKGLTLQVCSSILRGIMWVTLVLEPTRVVGTMTAYVVGGESTNLRYHVLHNQALGSLSASIGAVPHNVHKLMGTHDVAVVCLLWFPVPTSFIVT